MWTLLVNLDAHSLKISLTGKLKIMPYAYWIFHLYIVQTKKMSPPKAKALWGWSISSPPPREMDAWSRSLHDTRLAGKITKKIYVPEFNWSHSGVWMWNQKDSSSNPSSATNWLEDFRQSVCPFWAPDGNAYFVGFVWEWNMTTDIMWQQCLPGT